MAGAPSHRDETAAIDAIPVPPGASIFVFDRDGIRAVDRAAIDDYAIPGIVLMENAARGLADNAMASPKPEAALIICGSGNNGGDGYALARHLHNRDVKVLIATLDQPKPGTDAATNADICRRMSLPLIDAATMIKSPVDPRISLVVDAIFGTGLDRPIEGLMANVIEWINSSGKPVLAVDIPSGMDCNTGAVLGHAVRASTTVTLMGWKTGFLTLGAQRLLGEIAVVDIGVPVELAERFGRRIGSRHPDSPDHARTELEVAPHRR